MKGFVAGAERAQASPEKKYRLLFRQQRRLRAFRPCNEALHQCPRQLNSEIITSVEFSHSQGHERACGVSRRHGSSTPNSRKWRNE